MPRRRKKRSALNPAGWIPPETWATIGKAIAGGLVVASPAVAIRQGQEASTKVQAANQNTNAALASVVMLIDEQEALKARIVALESEAVASRIRYARLIKKSPAALVGPSVPDDWLPQPPKRPGWFARMFRGKT